MWIPEDWRIISIDQYTKKRAIWTVIINYRAIYSSSVCFEIFIKIVEDKLKKITKIKLDKKQTKLIELTRSIYDTVKERVLGQEKITTN